MKKPSLLLLLLLAGIYTTHACAADTAAVWAIGDCHKINPVTGKDYNPVVPKDIAGRNYLWDSRSNTVTLFGANNEYISFQVIIEAKAAALKDVNVTFSDLTGAGTIKNENIKLFKEHYTNVYKASDWPLPSTGIGEYPDALIPFETPEFGAPFSISAKRNQAIWVDIFIPKGTPPGEYSGFFYVSAGASVIKEAKITLAVFNFTLPDENHLIFWSNYGYDMITRDYGVQPGDDRYNAVEESIWKIAHEHRMNALLRHAQIRPDLSYNQYGQLIIDYQNYGRRLGKYISGRIFDNKLPPGIFLLPLSGGTEGRWPGGGPIDDPDMYFSYACKDLAAYYKEMGWQNLLDRCYVYLSDEPEPETLFKIVKDAELIHKADKRLKTMVALYKAFNAETVEKLAGSVDLWLVDASYYKTSLLMPRKRTGERIGFYQQSEPYIGNENLDSDALGFVTWPWIAWKYNVDCVYLYHMNIWGGLEPGHTVWDYSRNQSWSNSQGVLIYPGNYIGQDEVVGSIRLKEIRRGMQDYEYMYLAKERGADPDRIVNSIIVRALDEARRGAGNPGEWSHDPAEWFRARQDIGRLIVGERPAMSKVKGIPYINPIRQKLSHLKKNTVSEEKKIFFSLPAPTQAKLLSLRQGMRDFKKNVKAMIANIKSGRGPFSVPSAEAVTTGPVRVTVYPDREKRRISPLIYGSNLCPKSESDRKIWKFVGDTGITAFRFPGGDSPGWRWQTGTADFNEKVKDMPLGKIDYLIKFCEKTGTKLIMQVNLESGTSEEAAGLVDYLNNIRKFRVDYWELGNEVAGDWDRAHTTPEKYAGIIKEYSLAMKAKDPAIKIGADWGGEYYDSVKWDRTIIKNAGDYIDFISIHWYPNIINKRHPFDNRVSPTPEEVMGNALEIPAIVGRARKIFEEEAPQRKGKIEIAFLEWDGASDAPSSNAPPYAQNIAQWSLANAIFYADSLGQFAETGVTVSAHYMFQECMFGLIRGWDRGEGWGGQEWDTLTIRPKAFAIKLFSEHFGDILVENKTENSPFYNKSKEWLTAYKGNVPYVTCYASRFSNNGKLGLVLINKHPQKDFDVSVLIDSNKKIVDSNVWALIGPKVTAQNDGEPRTVDIKGQKTALSGNRFTYKLPAHSVVAIEMELS